MLAFYGISQHTQIVLYGASISSLVTVVFVCECYLLVLVIVSS